jgi:hypothetical protein
MEKRPEIHVALSHLVGRSAWGLRRDLGSIFFLELGEPLARIGQLKPHGEWHLLIQLCHWRFETPESVLVGSEDDQTFIDATFASLKLGSVETAEVLPPSQDLQISFSSGVRFKTFTTSKEATNQWNQWHLFGPDEYVWISDGGGHVQCKKRDEPVRP